MKPLALGVGLLGIAALWVALASSIRAQDPATTELQRLQGLAQERYAEGNLTRAAELYREIAALTPERQERARALLTASWLQHLDGNQALAVETLQQALQLDPEHSFDAALYDREFELLYGRTQDTIRQQQRAEAAARIRGALEAGHDGDARQLLESALELWPNHPVALFHLARLAFREGALNEALADFERVVSLTSRDSSPEMSELHAEALTHIGIIHRHEGRLVEAEHVLLEAVRVGSTTEAAAWKHLGLLRLQRNELTDALAALRRGRELEPEDPELNLALIRALHRSGQTDEATELLEAELRRRPGAAELWLEQGRAHLAAGKPVRAIASLGRAAELRPDNPEIWMALGEAYEADDRLAEAEASWRRALTLDPGASEVTAALQQVRTRLATERAIVSGRAKPRKPFPPKKIGLEFANLDYKDLELRGALVKQVRHQSPAARAGLRKGDLILWIGDYEVLSDRDFFQYLKRNPPGDRVEIEYLRDGRVHPAELRLR